MPRFLVVPHPALGLPLPVERAPAEDVIFELELSEDEVREWQDLVARAVLELCDRN